MKSFETTLMTILTPGLLTGLAASAGNEPTMAGRSANNQELNALSVSNDINLAVYEAGSPDGVPIVFIHGYLQTHLAWTQQLFGPLTDEFRLVALDLRGHGASDKPLDAAYYADSALWANDINAVIEVLDLERPVLVGWSYGGTVIADYIREFGEDAISGVVFVGAVTNLGTEEALAQYTDGFQEVRSGLVSPSLQANIDATRTFSRLQTAQPVNQERLAVILGGAMMVPPDVRLALGGRQIDNDDVLAGIASPTLVIHGHNDGIIRLSHSEHIADTVPDAMLRVYDEIGHMPFYEDPERFNRNLAEFVRTVRQEED